VGRQAEGGEGGYQKECAYEKQSGLLPGMLTNKTCQTLADKELPKTAQKSSHSTLKNVGTQQRLGSGSLMVLFRADRPASRFHFSKAVFNSDISWPMDAFIRSCPSVFIF
jgi:hypothetical protein